MNSYKLKEIFRECCPEEDLSLSECKVFYEFLKLNNISKLIFDFDIKPLLCLLDYYEKQEDYLQCLNIKNKIEKHNKVTQENYKTHL